MPDDSVASSRREELLERSYRYVLQHGLADLSLRPLAAAIGSSPRVLLFLFGSKAGLVRAVLARARTEEVRLLAERRQSDDGLAQSARTVWGWLVDEAHRPLLVLWLEVYARSLTDPDGPWAGFARQTVEDWLDLFAGTQRQGKSRAEAERTLCLAVLRGALLDLLATGDAERTTAAVELHLQRTRQPLPRSS